MVTITPGTTSDLRALDTLVLEPGAIYVMDRGYIDFTRLYAFAQAGAFFVVRSRERLQHARVASHAVDRTTGLRCDQTIRLTGPRTQHAYPAPLRRVRFRDVEHDRSFTYLTNLVALPALTIATLYKLRWQVELSAQTTHYVADTVTFTLAPNANIQFVSGGANSAVITSVVVPKDWYLVQFWVKDVAQGDGSVNITATNYQPYATPTVIITPGPDSGLASCSS